MTSYTPSYPCPECGHSASRHFILGTKCAVDGCKCMQSQQDIILHVQAEHASNSDSELAALRAENAKLREALELIARGDVISKYHAEDYKRIARRALEASND